MKSKLDFKNILDNPKFIKTAVIVGISAVALIFLSSYIDTSSFTQKADIDEYCVSLEEKLLSVVTQIEGVGEAKIFLTMDNNGENVYLNNSDTKTKSITPVVRGVVIVCDGGDEPLVVSRVMSAVTKSLDISSNKVCVTKLSN
ncbi:MAG: hypothetical protein IJ275_02285 [Ruminococcus sp.]|nr:hypothetical protein [Ruminococcus sp.]